MRISRMLVLGWVALGVLLCTPLAAAKQDESPGKVKTRTATTTVAGQNTIGTAVATCPKGSKVVSGGFATTPASVIGNPSPHIAIVHESRRVGTRSWQVSGGQVITGADQLTAYAYCQEGLGKVKERVTTVPVAAAFRSEGAATANCPKGSKALSGGFQLPGIAAGGTFIFPTAFEMLGNEAWTLSGVRNGVDASAPSSISTFVYCLKDAGSARVASGSGTFTASASADVFAAASASCAKRRTAVGGGFRAPYTQQGVNRTATLIGESRRSGRTWLSSGYVTGTTNQSVGLTTLAYCR